MSSPVGEPTHNEPPVPDDPMQGSGQEDEGEGDSVGPAISDDSSEEPEEDEEEERRIREGFIVDEDDEEEEGSDEEEERRRRRKRRKRRHRERAEEEVLEEDDLELLEENTGASFSRRKHRLTRLRRGRDSESPQAPSSSKRHAVVESSDEEDDLDLPKVQDIHNIWDDERRREDDEDADMDDMDNFIEYEEEEEPGAMDEEAREERRRERKRLEKERRRAMGSRPELTGIDASAWEEIYEVFGDGHDFDWALEGDDELPNDEEQVKPDMRYQDVFEPSEIRARMLTEDDDLIRAHDTPERMQLATSSLSRSATLSLNQSLTENDLDDAAQWVVTRLSSRKERDFFRQDGQFHRFLMDLVQAVTHALRFLFIQEFEVPYIWTHKRDYISYFNPTDLRTRVELLTLDDLWRVYTLGQKYRSLVERRKALDSLYSRIGVSDPYFEEVIRPRVDSVEAVADATEWLTMKYRENQKRQFEMHFHDDEEQQEVKKSKLPSRVSAYELAKKSIVANLAEGFGIKSHEIVKNVIAHTPEHLVDEPEVNPIAYAEQFVDSDPSKALAPEELLRRARMIIATELGKDPILREEIRKVFKSHAQVSVLPTERGVNKITEHDPYFNFKYLHNKPVTEMLETSQFLSILTAESEHLVTVSIHLPAEAKSAFERRLHDAFTSDNYSETSKTWNAERLRVIQETIDQHLLPAAVKWTREWLREEAEDFYCRASAQVLRSRVDVAPYHTPEMQAGDTPSVLAMSWGQGNPQKDVIAVVFLDEAGRLREHTKLDNLYDQDNKDEFLDILRRRRPDVIVIGGFSIATTSLSKRVKELLNPPPPDPSVSAWGEPTPPTTEETFNIPVIYVYDEIARLYQNSKRADEEFSALSTIAKYCVGLARYAQSPLNEYAALGADIAAVSYVEGVHHQIPIEKLLTALERVLVDVTNKVGVDINRAVTDSYYQRLLPFVCGLGPRKAQVLVKKIAGIGGTLTNREQFIKNGLLTTKIFLNAAGFLRIVQSTDSVKPSKSRRDEDADIPDPLDNTRIHPEDYELARKMATDALELDEEDVHDEHPSYVVSLIMNDEDNVKKLDELNLDDFAVNMYETSQDKKRHTLNVIRAELLKPFGEMRKNFELPNDWDVLTMLTGENQSTLRIGNIVSAIVLRVNDSFVMVRLDSGIEGVINAQYLADEPVSSTRNTVKKGQSIQGVIIDVKLSLDDDSFGVELSSRPGDVRQGDAQYRRVKHDDYWNVTQFERDMELQARKKRAEVDKARRVIKHPNFHNFNAAQAEAFLDKQQRGDVVIRPSSKGANHIAVTWKVDDKLYQHIDVVESGVDATGQGVGSRLIVDGSHQYSDLDELIVNHVQAMARKVEELMAHEKFKAGSEEDLHLFLKNFVAANPAKSAYGFTLNRKRPGHFNLCFLASKNSTVQSWPVRVTPEAYYLFETPAAGVPELCDAFKVRHLHESQNLSGAGGRGGKTPYVGARTPARTPAPGHATPGHMSVRQIGRTPNPYGPRPGAPPAPPPATQFGGMPPPQTPYAGYQTPGYGQPPPPNPPSGMNPQRAAMIQQSSGWGAPPNAPW